MNRLLLLFGLLVMAMGTATAQFVGPGTSDMVTVKSILDRPVDDMFVALKGYIVRKISHDKYIFKDHTGEIRVDIDEKYFPYGTPVTTQTLVLIKGEVDKEFMILPAGSRNRPENGPSNRPPSRR